MKCVFCGCKDNKVVDSRYLKDTAIRRRRECINCGKRFTTYETVETSPMIVTNVLNEREPFKIDKLIESLKYATYCQNVSDIQELADSIAENGIKNPIYCLIGISICVILEIPTLTFTNKSI